MYNTFLAALCVVLLSLTGIIGTMSIIFCGRNTFKDITVYPDSENDIEYKVRTALKRTRGNVIIDTERSDKSGDFDKICGMLCKDDARIIERKRNIEQ